MKTFGYHFKGIEETLKTLFKGNYLIYFIPGGIITIIYLYILYRSGAFSDSIDLDTGVSWLGWLTTAGEWLLSGVFGAFEWFLEQIYVWIVITLLAPFHTYLAEKFDSQLTGQKFEANWIRFINDLIRMVWIVIIALLLELGFMLLYWMVSWLLPDVLDPIMYHLIAAFFFGFAYYDFHLERYEVGVLGSMGYAFENVLTMLLTGSIFILIYAIPYLGIPLAPVLTVMISCVVYLYKEKKLPVQPSSAIEEINNESNV